MILNSNTSIVVGELANSLVAAINLEPDSVARNHLEGVYSFLVQLCNTYHVNLGALRSAVALLENSYDEAQSDTQENNIKVVKDGDEA